MKMFTSSALTALSLALSACGGTYNGGLETVHQPVVQRTDYVFDAATGSNGLSVDEGRRLAGWLDAINLGYGDRIAVDDSNATDAARNDVAAIAGRYGLLLSDAVPVTAGGVAPGAIRVIVSRTSAGVPNCPDWSGQTAPEYRNGSMQNYGCATNSNFAAMAANPEDLVFGRTGDGTVDAALSSKAIKSYRDKAPTGAGALKSESSN